MIGYIILGLIFAAFILFLIYKLKKFFSIEEEVVISPYITDGCVNSIESEQKEREHKKKMSSISSKENKEAKSKEEIKDDIEKSISTTDSIADKYGI